MIVKIFITEPWEFKFIATNNIIPDEFWCSDNYLVGQYVDYWNPKYDSPKFASLSTFGLYETQSIKSQRHYHIPTVEKQESRFYHINH